MLSPTGWGVLAGGLVLTGVGYGFGYSEAAVLGVAGVLAVAFAAVWTLPKPGITAQRRIAPRKVARGDDSDAVVTLTNPGTRTRRGLRATDMCGAERLIVQVPVLPGGQQHEVRYALPTRVRGRIPVGPLLLERTDPLGLCRRARPASGGAAEGSSATAAGTVTAFSPGTASGPPSSGRPAGRARQRRARYREASLSDVLVVRPRICLLPVLPSGTAHHVEGPTSDTANEGSLTFHALREYVLGDDLRRVHWRSSARTGTLMVRQMIDVSLPHTTVVLDTRSVAYATPDDFELAVDSAASIAHAAARSNFPVHLLVTSGATAAGEAGTILHTEGAGANDSDALLDRLAVVHWTTDRTSAAPAFDALEQHRHGGTLVVITGTGDASGFVALGRVCRRFERTVVVRARKDPQATGGLASGGLATAAGSIAVDVPQIHIGSLDALLAGWRWEAVN